MNFLRSKLAWAAVIPALASLGCETAIVRTVDATTAAKLGPGATVVAVKRQGQLTRIVSSASPTPLTTAGGEHISLSRGDEVTVQFAPGATVPGEGVVRQRPSTEMLAAGGVAAAAGAGFLVGMAACAPDPPNSYLMSGHAICQLGLGALGGSVLLTGLIVLFIGAGARLDVERASPTVSFAPMISPSAGGAAVALRF